jgi:Xaa-Pro aminopeptidase
MGWEIDSVKLDRVRTLMAAEGLDTLVVRTPDNVSYLTNYWPMKGYDIAVLPLHGEPTLFVMEPQYEEARATAWTQDVQPFPFYDPADPRPPALRASEAAPAASGSSTRRARRARTAWSASRPSSGAAGSTASAASATRSWTARRCSRGRG